MRSQISGVLLTMAVGLCAFAASDGPLRIPKDTAVQLRLRKAVSSSSAHPNDLLEFEVLEDVRADHVTVIPRGSLAWGTVIESSPKARMARAGKLEINISAACVADGSMVPLRAGLNDHGGNAGEGDSNESLLALPALPLLLFVYGKDVTLPAGKLYTVYTDEALNVDSARIEGKGPNRNCGPVRAAAGLEPLAASPALSTGSLSTVRLESAPAFGEVYVDGKFFGNTPSTLRLPAGDHVISVRLSGKKTWERVLSLTPGGETVLSAVLEEPGVISTVAARSEVKEH